MCGALSGPHYGAHRTPGAAVPPWPSQVSFLEIYNEQVRDLLAARGTDQLDSDAGSAGGARPPLHERSWVTVGTGGTEALANALRVRTHPKHGPYVEGLSEVPVSSAARVRELVEAASAARIVAATSVNEQSSRSHAIFVLKLKRTGPDGRARRSKLSLVDLAGSERAGQTGASGDRLREAANINRSLSALGTVINALAARGADQGADGVVPYRNSVLCGPARPGLGKGCSQAAAAAHRASSPPPPTQHVADEGLAGREQPDCDGGHSEPEPRAVRGNAEYTALCRASQAHPQRGCGAWRPPPRPLRRLTPLCAALTFAPAR